MLGTVPDLFSVNFDDYPNREYITGLSQWDLSARFPPDAYLGPAENLLNRWQARYNEMISSPGAHAFYAGVVYMEAIKRGKSLDEDDILFHLSRLDIGTLKGRLAWTGEHAQLGTSLFVQYNNGSLRTVGPVQAATERVVYPAPTWKERVANSATYSMPIDYVMSAIQILGIVLNVVFLVLLLKYWREMVFRASSPVFLCVILLGSTILLAQPWTMIPDAVSDAACHLRPWLLALGFGLLFGAMFAKSWRIWYLFSNQGVSIFKVSDGQLSLIIGIILGVEVLLCVLISSVAQPRAIAVVPDSLRPIYNYSVCSAGTAWNALLGVLGVYNAIIILVGVYLTIRVRVNYRSRRFSQTDFFPDSSDPNF